MMASETFLTVNNQIDHDEIEYNKIRLGLYQEAAKLFQRKLEMPQYTEYLNNETALNILWQDCCREIHMSNLYDGRRKNLGDKICSSR